MSTSSRPAPYGRSPRPRAGRPARTLGTVVATALALTFGGCNVTTDGGPRSQQREAAREVVGDGELTIDLSSPPTRADLALPEGRTSTVLMRDEREPFDVTVVFRTANVLVTIVFSQWSTGTPAAPPSADLQLGADRVAQELAGQFD